MPVHPDTGQNYGLVGLEKTESVLLSIGPVCAQTHHGMTQKQLVKLQQEKVASLDLALV